jgi:hypothetical protein
MKETNGSKRTELVKTVKHRARMNKKCGEKNRQRGKEMTRKKKEKMREQKYNCW